MKEIKLTQGKIAFIDDEDFDLISKYSWRARKSGPIWYAETSIRKENGARLTIGMHRFLLGVSDRKIQVDHINGDGLDNQRSNLRKASHIQNQHNRHKGKTNSSGYRGVCFHKRDKLFTAQIRQNKKQIHLGSFKTAELASEAYENKAREIHGEFYRYPALGGEE